MVFETKSLPKTEMKAIKAITREPEGTNDANYGYDKSDFLHRRFMQAVAHEVPEKTKRLPAKKTSAKFAQ